MIEQAGIYRITLYENVGIDITYVDSKNISAISNTGEVIELENSDCETSELRLEFDFRQSANNKTNYRHSLSVLKYGYDNETLEYFHKITDSIYGWIPKVEFYNGDIKVYTNPFKSLETEIDTNVSMSININLRNVIFGEKPLDFQ